MMTNAKQPATTANAIAGSERIDLLDGLRGFALLGILIANLPVLFGWVFMPPEQMAQITSPQVAESYQALVTFFVDGKFYTIFSMLFGIGFTLQLDRLEHRGAQGVAVFRRRMLVLLAIGLTHMCLIWSGDILTLYAALGLLLPLFRKWSERKLVITALLLLALPLALEPLRTAAGIDLGAPFEQLSGQIDTLFLGAPIADPVAAVRSTDWRWFFAWQLDGSPWRIAHLLHTWRIPKVLGVMLIGMVLGRRLMAGTLLNDRRLMWRTVVIGLAIGVPCNLYFALHPKVYQEHWSAVIGTAPMGFAYAALFTLAWPRAKAVLGQLAPVGRMALTSYLTHSLIGVLLLGPFLGLATRVGPIGFTLLALPIYAAQIVFSRWWLARHAQGPMEQLWRWGTYGSAARATQPS